MSSIFKSALLISSVAALVLFQFASAAPQDFGLGGGMDSFGLGADMGAFTGPGGPDFSGIPTQVPVSPVSIIPETDFIPINNVQPVVNVLPVNVNDFSWPPYYNDYYGGAFGGIGGGLLGGGPLAGGFGGPMGGLVGGGFGGPMGGAPF
ncbi:hypothetical protein BGZ91_004913 [Linnemannia elongata]|nr:hypothetical protein BGZ91_004913 [Linnemannia elongata]KAG0057257.1 hypothetical protein BGZ90_005362 [Linnemannia elongata]